MVLVVPAVVALAAVVRLLEVEDTLPDLPRPELVADAVLDEYGFDVVLSDVHQVLEACVDDLCQLRPESAWAIKSRERALGRTHDDGADATGGTVDYFGDVGRILARLDASCDLQDQVGVWRGHLVVCSVSSMDQVRMSVPRACWLRI